MLSSFSNERFTEKEQRQILLRRIFRRVFLEDWGTKLIALGITFALWLGITGLRAPITVTLNPVLITRISNDMEVVSAPIDTINIVVTGDKRLIDQLYARVNSRDLVASIDLTGIKAGDQKIELSPDTVNFELPSGFKVDKFEPSKIFIKLEQVVEKEVEVKAETEGSPAEGYELYSTNILPAKVRVRGAESFIKSLASVSTEKINIEGLKDSFFARQIGLNVVNPKLTLIDTIVDVNFKIGEKRIERSFVIPVKSETKTQHVTVLIIGGRSIVENLRNEDLKADIVKNEAGEESAVVTLPDELQNSIEIHKVKISDH